MQNLKAIIAGGGIAGAVAALYFQRAGIEAEIYESRRESESYGGWFLNLAGNGTNVLRAIGEDAAIRAEGSPAPRMVMWNSGGKRLGEVRNGARDGLTTSVLIRRAALQQLLYEAVRAQGIPVHFGKRLHGIEDGAKGVTVTFEDGTSASGDFVIGADGVHSRARQIINPAAPAPRYTGLISTGGFTSRANLSPTPETQHFVFGKRAFFGYHVRSSGEVYWFNNFRQDAEPTRGDLSTTSSEAWKQRLLEMHRDDMPLIGDIIRATDGGIGGYAIYDIAMQPVWHKGRVVLVGDAIHAISPSSGQGASLAMEDAAVLAKSVRESASLEEAFTSYEGERRPRVERMVDWAHKLGGAKLMTNPIQVFMRDLLMPVFLKLAANPAALDWIYAYDVEWDAAAARELA